MLRDSSFKLCAGMYPTPSTAHVGSAGVAMTVVPKRAYTLEFKLSVVEWVESNQQSYRAAARQFGLDRKIIRTWVGRKASLVSALATHGPKRKKVHRGEGCGEQGDSRQLWKS